MLPQRTRLFSKRTSGRGQAVLVGEQLRQPLPDLPRGVLRRLAVQVAAGRCRGGRGVGHLAGVGGAAAHTFERQAEFVRHHLRHLGVQALAHLGAAVVHQHRTVGVDMHQRAGLVVVVDVERDAEFHRRQRQPLLQHRTGGVVACDGLTARAVVGCRHQLVGQRLDDVVAHRLPVRRDVVSTARRSSWRAAPPAGRAAACARCCRG